MSSRPSDDKTNPDPKLIHTNFPHNITDQPSGSLDDTLENERVRNTDVHNGVYPDDYVSSRSENLDDQDTLSKTERNIEDFYGTTTSFDPEGDEGEPEETRPLENDQASQ